MSEGDAILRDIIDNPADDGLRLIYADWLEDNGQVEQAGLIRVQVELYKLETDLHDAVVSHLSLRGWETPKSGCNCKPCSLRRNERCLWRAKAENGGFAIPPAEPLGGGMPDYLFSEDVWPKRPAMIWRRGFVHTIRCTMQAWLDHGKDICVMHPIERVEITDRSAAHSLGNSPEFRWFRRPQEHPKNQVFGMSHLHQGIFDLLEGGTLNHGNWCRFYPTETEAIDALSRACLAYARQLTQSPTAKV